jgi:hypothetical protein
MEEKRIQLEEQVTMENLWSLIEKYQGETFYTARKLPFTYTVKGGEMFTERKKKSITRSTFEKAYQRVLEDPEGITGPKKLNVFGGPYVWAIFMAFGIVG